MFEFLAGVGVLLAFVFLRLGESRLNQSNLDFLIFAGAEEIIPKQMLYYYRTEWYFLAACAIEFLFFPKAVGFSLLLPSILILMLAAILRVWTINTLGRFWSRKCLYVPGYPKVTHGPYRFFKHPEYVARIAEVVGLGLFLGAYVSLTVMLISQAYLLTQILRAESFQLRDLSIPPLKSPTAQ